MYKYARYSVSSYITQAVECNGVSIYIELVLLDSTAISKLLFAKELPLRRLNRAVDWRRCKLHLELQSLHNEVFVEDSSAIRKTIGYKSTIKAIIMNIQYLSISLFV